ncbi:hypothetical protein [Streptomyces sp. NBC_00470]|uniref:hypothetical protein n=1 Tax=Streptomyces sp. NBC_00470 TaxID=2975753 RepID=UPI002F906DE7
MPNTELAARIHSELAHFPEHHDQRTPLAGLRVLRPGAPLTDGTCNAGTTLSVAGFAAYLSGHTIECDPYRGALAYTPGSRARRLGDAARDALGVTAVDADWLFAPARTRPRLLTALAQLADGADHITHPAAARRTPATVS